MSQKNNITFEDNRIKKIVFVSNCLLNQNCRFPGIATFEGNVLEILEPILKKGIGIEQLPCLECMGWGGVSRKSIFKFLPTIKRHYRSKLFPIIKLFGKIWYWNYKRLCKKVAKKEASKIKDYKNSGYEILGIITMNDSPTCGVTRTIDLLNFIFNYKDFGFKLEDLEYPKLEKMKEIISKLLIEGQGTFTRELLEKLKKLKINIKIVGFNPWHNYDEEIERINKQIL
ncbi:MAG: DUF523 domain-containing protein [Candidatus Lokiarchaeota archaeon]|nr:DUF523 domain-containing protein [Candidatus Lokiarchaeota archaeon]